ncbi:MAG TPA: hypothetical protein EYP53_03700 [Candidatus Latescibacteria bacterium]|nr:hypothetical protein [Candidatus Latescibacterota bacterium]
MLGVQDFIGYYDWTFEYLRRKYGEKALSAYWEEAIAFDSQHHAYELVKNKGFEGMAEYWGHTLNAEEAGYTINKTRDFFRIDMFDCPSVRFLVRRGPSPGSESAKGPSKDLLIKHSQGYYHDYCEHCMGWVKPIMTRTGFMVDHEHNHQGQCWWEMHRAGAGSRRKSEPPLRGPQDVRKLKAWRRGEHHLYLSSLRVTEMD